MTTRYNLCNPFDKFRIAKAKISGMGLPIFSETTDQGMLDNALIDKRVSRLMRGMQNRETAKTILGGYLTHYNFFRPHQTLRGKTPAEVAGIRFPYRDWAEIVRGGKKLW